MFQYCTDPSILSQFKWFSCYLTSGKHISFYLSFLIVISLICITAPISLFFGFCGSLASRSSFILLKYTGLLYTNIVINIFGNKDIGTICEQIDKLDKINKGPINIIVFKT